MNMKQEKAIHVVFSKLLKSAQFFGYFPIENLSSGDPNKLQFKPKSLRMLYSVLTMCGCTFMLAMQFRKIYWTQMSMTHIERIVWYSSGVLSNIAFIFIARKWKKFINVWRNVEKSMSSYGWTQGLEKRINLIVGGLFCIAAIEFVSFHVSRMEMACNAKTGFKNIVTYFLRDLTYSHIFNLIPYSVPAALLLQVINIQITFAWNFVDIFIIVVSVCLSYRMKQITQIVEATSHSKSCDEKTWKNIRKDYCRLHYLCRYINDELWYLILFSMASNLFYVLVQCFNTLQPRTYFLEKAYFNFSFMLLIFRIVSFCLFAATVYEESKKPLKFLVYVPSEIYNPEIQMFIEQIASSEIAISGYNLFYIGPDLILKIAGALVTYELVLLEGMKGKQ